MHGNANIIVVMSDKQQPKNAFVREQIKDKPKNYKRMWVRLGESAACGGVFALAVCLVLLFMIPVLRQEEGSVPDTGAQDSQQASVEETEQGSEEKEETQTPEERQPMTLDDYQQIQTELYAIGNTANKSIVTITGVVSDTDWFNNSYEREGQGCGTIIGESGGKLWILTEKKTIKDAAKIKVTFVNDAVAEAKLVRYDGDTGLAALTVDLEDLEDSTRNAITVMKTAGLNTIHKGSIVIALGGHEAGIKARVVRYYGSVAHEVEEGAHGLRLARRTGDVAVAYAGELRDVGRYGHLRVDKGAELVAYLAALEEHCAYFSEAVRHCGEARGLHVEGHKLAVKQVLTIAAHGGALLHIVDVVALDAVEYLDAVLLPRLAHLGEGLGRAMVCDGYGLVAPGGGALHGLCRVGQRVECRVARVEVELHALFLRSVRTDLRFGLDYRVGLDDHVVVELVIGRPAADDERRAGLYLAEDGGVLALVEELVYADAAGVVGHVETEYRGAALLYLTVVDGKDLALDDDVASQASLSSNTGAKRPWSSFTRRHLRKRIPAA